jgi:hypothetical protein
MLEILKAIGHWLLDAFLWVVTGVVGSLQAGLHESTDVPWYQCLISSLIVAAFGFSLEFFIFEPLKKRRQRRKKEKAIDNDERHQ